MIKQHRYDSFFGYPHRWDKERKIYNRKYWKKVCPYSTRWRLCARIIHDMEHKNKRIAILASNRANIRKFGGA